MSESSIFLNIKPKFFDFKGEYPTGNFKIEVIEHKKVIKREKSEYSKYLIFSNLIQEEDDDYELSMNIIDIKHIVPAHQLKTYIRDLELEYNISKKIEDKYINDLMLKYISITKDILENSIPDDLVLNFGKYKDIKVKDIITSKRNYFIWLFENNEYFCTMIKDNEILKRYLTIN